MLWEECSRAEAWMSPMFSPWEQLVLQVFTQLKVRLGSLCMLQSAPVKSDHTFSTLKWFPMREKRFHNCSKGCQCLVWQQWEGVVNVTWDSTVSIYVGFHYWLVWFFFSLFTESYVTNCRINSCILQKTDLFSCWSSHFVSCNQALKNSPHQRPRQL